MNMVAKCIDLIDEEISIQQKKNDIFDVTGLLKEGKLQGLEIARKIIQEVFDEMY
jgi:hypothetical protein